MTTAFINATIFTGTGELTGKALLIENDEIAGIIDATAIPTGAEIIDCAGKYILPGFIDLQIYGAGGFLFSNNPTSEALHAMCNALAKVGTTGFLVTLATNSIEVFMEAIRVVKENPHPALLGLHLEGPYLNPVKKGAHIEAFIKIAEKEEVQSLLDEAAGVIKMMTLAPERTDAGIIRLLADNGVVVSAGHSNATFGEAVNGFENGIQTATHLFNAMSPIHHRDTGLPGATWLSQKACASIIADGVHVDYSTLSISKKMMGERLFLITDAVEENLTGAYIHIEKADRFILPDGTLSGSNLTMLRAVSNCVQHAKIPLAEAIRMASAYPAKLMGLTDKGKIEAGYKANLVIVNKELELASVYLEGKMV